MQNGKDNSTEESDRQTIVYSMTSKIVSAVTNKQNQENESNLKLFSWNWLGSDVDIEILQSEKQSN